MAVAEPGDDARPDILVVAGLSGAGRSTAADALEDQGWFVIDNLPPMLIPTVAELMGDAGSSVYEHIALVVGTGQHQADVLPALQQLRSTGVEVHMLFLEASTDVLVVRYKVGRRRHPLSTGASQYPGAMESAQITLSP